MTHEGAPDSGEVEYPLLDVNVDVRTVSVLASVKALYGQTATESIRASLATLRLGMEMDLAERRLETVVDEERVALPLRSEEQARAEKVQRGHFSCLISQEAEAALDTMAALQGLDRAHTIDLAVGLYGRVLEAMYLGQPVYVVGGGAPQQEVVVTVRDQRLA